MNFISLPDITRWRKERTLLIEEAKRLPAAVFYYEKLAFLWIKDQETREAAKRIIEERLRIPVAQGQEGLQGFLLIFCRKGEEIFDRTEAQQKKRSRLFLCFNSDNVSAPTFRKEP